MWYMDNCVSTLKRGFVIGASKSGSGKTTLSLGLIAALIKRGYIVQPFKVGPDYIDTGLHTVVAKRTSFNLDIRMCGEEYVKEIFTEQSSGVQISIVEGVMGLFDGRESSTASIAKTLDLPILLIIDARSMAESSAALLKGFETYMEGLRFCGVLFNMIGSEKHFRMIEEAVKGVSEIPILGWLPRKDSIKIPERHLGLHTAFDNPLSSELMDDLPALLENRINIDLLLKRTQITPGVFKFQSSQKTTPFTKMAVAKDKAFCFYYEDNLTIVENQGVEIVFFSPLKDKTLPQGVHGLYLGGGYPELYAKELSENSEMMASIKEFINRGGVTYAECGGFIYLTQGVVYEDNQYFKMAGVYPVTVKMGKKVKRLGYREIVLKKDTIIGRKGETLKGHEFHYSNIEEMPHSIERVYQNRENGDGYAYKNCLASYIHLHFGSNRVAIRRLNEKMRQYSP